MRQSFGNVVFDRVLPPRLDGLVARLRLHGRPVEIRCRVRGVGREVSRITVNGSVLPLDTRESNPYRAGGWRVPLASLALSNAATNAIDIEL